MKIYKRVNLKAICFFSICLFLTCFQLHSQQKNTTVLIYQTLTPAKLLSEVPLKNPGIGIEQASLLESRTGKTVPTRPGTVGPRNNSLDGVASIRYIRSDWVSLEPADNEFHWATLEANINDAWSKGQQTGFSINTASPVLGGSGSYWQNVPAWFINDPRHIQCTAPSFPEGCTYYKIDFTNCSSMGTGADCSDNFGVNHDDPEFIKQQIELIEAIRLRYDNPQWAAKWAYMDMRNWGVWGEWQTDEARITGTGTKWPHPSLENKKAIIDAFIKFDYIPVIANYHDQVSWLYACEQGALKGKTVGWRTDGIDVTAWLINPAISNYPVIRDAWKTGPVYGEVMGSSMSNTDITTLVLPRAYLWNMSGFNNKYDSKYSSDATYKSLIDEFRAKGGYRLSVDDVIIPVQVPQGETFNITSHLSNSGTSPLYRDYYNLSLKLSPNAGGNDIIIPLNGKIKGILPNSIGTFDAVFKADMAAGNYSISVGITGKPEYTTAPPPVSLANTGSVNSGPIHWCPVGTMNITYPVSVRELFFKKNSGSGSTKIYNMYGAMIKVLSPDISIDDWIGNTTLAPGIYLIAKDNVCIKRQLGMK